MRIRHLTPVVPLVSAAFMAVIYVSGANATAAPAKTPAAACVTYHIAEPEVSPPPGRSGPAEAPLIYFTFCGKGIQKGSWICPVKTGQLIADRPVNCRK